MHVSGAFDVDLQPLDPYAASSEGVTLARMSIDKTFHGDLDAKSQGEMLSATTPVQGSAGYVAIEQVGGTLQGKAGTFVLQHFGMMHKGESRLLLEVIPGSGTGELEGLTGTMAIQMKDGGHGYEFEYTLP
jgi:hypothetical protein